MNAIITDREMDVLKRTLAKDCNATEFDLYMLAAKRYNLDPFRRQIIPMIFSKDKPDKRQLTLILTRDGYRCVAARCGNYRPKSEPAKFFTDPSLKSDHNPAGLVSVSVTLHIQDSGGTWWPVSGEAYWEEFAPLEAVWGDDEKSGRRKIVGKKLPDLWAKMPRNMLEKCAESQALRAGWPEQFSGAYGEEEMEKAIVEDRTASEIAEAGRLERTMTSLQHSNSIPLTFGDGIEFVPVGQYFDRWAAYMHEHKDQPALVVTMREQNREGLKQYWAHEKDAALELKTRLEAFEHQLDKEQA
jgi:phage recombination protein Bet